MESTGELIPGKIISYLILVYYHLCGGGGGGVGVGGGWVLRMGLGCSSCG